MTANPIVYKKEYEADRHGNPNQSAHESVRFSKQAAFRELDATTGRT